MPWAHLQAKTIFQELQDKICDMPGLMEDADQLKQIDLHPQQRSMKYKNLSDNVVSHVLQLYEWRIKMEQLNSNHCYEATSLENDPEFPTVLYYSSLEHANGIATYNAILLLLIKLGFEIIGPPFASFFFSTSHVFPPDTQSPLIPPGTAPNAAAIATEICRSVEYHLSYGSSAGAFFLIFPLRMAWETFEAGTREKRWCEGVMGIIADVSGWEVGRLGEA